MMKTIALGNLNQELRYQEVSQNLKLEKGEKHQRSLINHRLMILHKASTMDLINMQHIVVVQELKTKVLLQEARASIKEAGQSQSHKRRKMISFMKKTTITIMLVAMTLISILEVLKKAINLQRKRIN